MVCPCCIKTTCTQNESGEVENFPGSSITFEGNGDDFRTLDFDTVSGYWLGASPEAPPFVGVNQSVTISFATVRPIGARVRVSALDGRVFGREEKFNYSFSGATSTVFTRESGFSLNDGSTVSMPAGNFGGRFRFDVLGDITEIFVEGEMINFGSNGIIVEVCLRYV